MSMPTDAEIAAAQRLGRAAARAGRELSSDSMPYPADGEPRQRVLAARFVTAYHDEQDHSTR